MAGELLATSQFFTGDGGGPNTAPPSLASVLSLARQLREENEALRREMDTPGKVGRVACPPVLTNVNGKGSSLAAKPREATSSSGGGSVRLVGRMPVSSKINHGSEAQPRSDAEACSQRALAALEEFAASLEAQKQALTSDMVQARRGYASIRQLAAGLKVSPGRTPLSTPAKGAYSGRVSSLNKQREVATPVNKPREVATPVNKPREVATPVRVLPSRTAAVVDKGSTPRRGPSRQESLKNRSGLMAYASSPDRPMIRGGGIV